MEHPEEQELLSLAKEVPHTKFAELCNALGDLYARGQKILATHHNDYDLAMQQLLIMEWKMKQIDTTQSRSILASKLRDIGLGALGDKLSQGAYQPNHCDQRDKETASLQSSPVMATQGSIADELLASLAEAIETGEQVEALGRALGFSTAAINRYTETNRLEGWVTCKGTREMLFDWRQKVKPCYQHLRLKEALINAKLVMLADTYLKDTPSLQDIYTKKISESLTVGQCREKLINKYTNSLCKIQKAPWDPNDLADFKDLHTVVTMVKKDARGRNTKTKEILQGSVDEIFSMKVNGGLPVRILVSAPAGRGKTTAVAKIAFDWANRAQGSSLENLPLLFVVKLRNTPKQTSIAEAIRSQLLSDVTDLTQDGLHRFIKENQGICHILLDGLDEYAGIAANQGLGSNIVNVMLWEEFPDCRVLVTTRPHMENFFNQGELPRVYTKMWIEGFSHESSREYIDKFFRSMDCEEEQKEINVQKGKDLKDYLDSKPLISELVITPLFCLMVCHLWGEGMLGNETTTQTELLDRVNLFLMHHTNARSKNKITEKRLGKVICKLGEVALTGLLNDAKKLVFTPHDFRKVPAILHKACELGIISKTTVTSARLPTKASQTTNTTIEFYHKLAQEHSAGKYLVDQTNKYLLQWRISKLDRVLRKIKENIGEYENLIRFAAGTDNSLCIRIMERLLANSYLDESERYRILLDCSSETSSTEGSVSSLIQRCVTAQRMVLKSPTVYTVVGMQNLPEQLISQIREAKFVDSGISANVTSGLWSCLGSFPSLRNLTITDSSLSFPLPPPELQSVTNLKAERVMSESYEGLLSSLPGVEEIEVTIDYAERDISQIMAGLRRTGGQQLARITLEAPNSLQPEKKGISRETMRRLGTLIKDQTKNLQMLLLSGVNSGDEEDLVALIECCRHAKSLDYLLLLCCGSMRGGKLESYAKDLLISKERLRVLISHEMSRFDIEKYQLSTEMTTQLWSSLSVFTSLSTLIISDSSLSFPPSPPVLTSVTRLEAKRVTSQSYEGLLSSLPGLQVIDIIIDDAERDISQITACLRRTGGQQLTDIRIEAPAPLPSEKKNVSKETMRGLDLLIRDQTKNLKRFSVSGVKCTDDDYFDLIESSTILPNLHLQFLGWGSLDYKRNTDKKPTVTLGQCQLSTEMTIRLWTCLRTFSSLRSLTISDSSLSFPPSPPELTSVTILIVKRVTSQSYKGLLSSIPNLKKIDITVGNEQEGDLSQIQTSLCRHLTGQELTLIMLDDPHSLPSEESVSGMPKEKMRGLGLHINDEQQEATLLGVVCGPGETVIDLVQGSTRVMSSILYSKQFSESMGPNRKALNIRSLTMRNCKLTATVTSSIWSCLRSFPSLSPLTISDSSLSFPPSPPELTSVTKLEAERVTSQSYEGLLSSLPGLKEITIHINAAERDISQITAGLRRTGGQQLTYISLRAQDSLPQEKKTVCRETMRGLGLLIRKQTKNLQWLRLYRVKCTDEEDLVDLIECCRHVKAMREVWLDKCGSKAGGRLQSHLKRLHSSGDALSVAVYHEGHLDRRTFQISHIP